MRNRRQKGLTKVQRQTFGQINPGRSNMAHVTSVPAQPFERTADTVVLFHLVLPRPGPLFRLKPASVADFIRAQPDYWFRTVLEHFSRNKRRRRVGFLAHISSFPHALLRLQLRRPGKRQTFHSYLFSQTGGDLPCDDPLRRARACCSGSAAEKI